jgi:uncharacterized membrane protein
MVTPNSKPKLTAQQRAEAERKEEMRNRIIMAVVLLVCVIGLVWVMSQSTPQPSLNCDGSGGSLLQFGTCR